MDRDERAFSLMDDAATISAIVRRVPAERLGESAFDGWSWLDVIGHLADTAALFTDRVARILREEEPALPDVDTDAWVRERRAARVPLACAKAVAAEHARLVRLLDEPGALARYGVHSLHGRVSAGWIADYHARHAHDHTLAVVGAFPPA